MKIHFTIIASLLLGLWLGSLPSVAANPTEVHIQGFQFQPAVLHVQAGAAVVWINDDQEPHKVSSVGDQVVAFPVLDTGEKCSVRLSKKGEYHYFCTMHPHMQGTIVVE